MVKSLEHMNERRGIWELDLFSLEKSRFKYGVLLIVIYQYKRTREETDQVQRKSFTMTMVMQRTKELQWNLHIWTFSELDWMRP